MVTDWLYRWFTVADTFASWSKDRSTKVGCVIVSAENQVISGGYNGFPRGVVDDVESRHQRPDKYLYTEHAERNAIYDAARRGIALAGATIYTPFFPCADCTRAIIQSGIIRVVTRPQNPDGKYGPWRHSWQVSEEMMTEASIDLVMEEL